MSGGLFFGINIALKGMMAQQSALNVTSHNIANANTPGYTRQRANLESSIPMSGLKPGTGQMGSGVEVGEIRRIRDAFVDYQIRNETSKLGKWESISETLEQIETVFMEPSETGFNDLLGQFWSDWQELSKFAESSPIRTTLKETAVSLTDMLRHMRDQLTDIQNDTLHHIEIELTDINSITSQIARLNNQIVNISLSNDNPNDLLDKRDNLLEELAKIGNVTITDIPGLNGEPSGAVEVKLGDITVVDQSGAKEVTSVTLEDGELAGLQKVAEDGEGLDTDTVQYYINKLDSLAVGLAKAVNDIHSQGKTLDGSTGSDFFVFKDQDGNVIDLSSVDWNDPFASGLSAGNIYVNPEIESDPSKIAAAKGDVGVGQDALFMKGNGETALEIAKLKDQLMDYDPQRGTLTVSDSGGTTLSDFYKDLVAELGVATEESGRMVTNQETLVEQLQKRRESLSGVSLDEEMANMVRFQHAYQANARVISVMDELLSTIVNGLIR
ncbi:MAG: flgK [Clostridiales bacterium]|nr:flgK [Clostridiales bacterium]